MATCAADGCQRRPVASAPTTGGATWASQRAARPGRTSQTGTVRPCATDTGVAAISRYQGCWASSLRSTSGSWAKNSAHRATASAGRSSPGSIAAVRSGYRAQKRSGLTSSRPGLGR